MHLKLRKILLSTTFLLFLLATFTSTALANGRPGSDQQGINKTSEQGINLHAKISQTVIPLDNLPYDHTDPANTRDARGNLCSSTAKSPYSWSDKSVTLELRFSVGCQTAWARVTPKAAIGSYTVSAIRVSDGQTESYTTSSVQSYTYQLNDAGSYHTKACVTYNYRSAPSKLAGCTLDW